MDIRRRAILSEILYGGGSNEEPINIDNYLTIEARENGLTASLSKNACEYCVDGDGDWKSLAAGTTTEAINSGQTLSFRGNLTPNSSNGIGTFTISKKCNLEGNCMSLLFGDDAANNYSLSGKSRAFYQLFHYCSNIVNVSSDFLPATTLANYCYDSMFYNCTSLTAAPELPATTLAHSCYSSMFRGCTSLTVAPELPATTLAGYCYYDMFENCTRLTTAPELPATTLANYCYYYMFRGCTSLTVAPELPATTLAHNCYSSMFRGCTSLTVAPELPATTLASYCYGSMFYGCSKLNYIKMLATNISATDCLSNWVSGVSSTGTFVKNPAMTSLPTGDSGIPEGWTVVNDGEPIINIDNYLTIEARENGLTASLSKNACEYCVDGDGNWKNLSAGTATENINSGHTLSFRGNLTSAFYESIGTFTISKKCNLKGNCMSMLFGDNAANNFSLSGKVYAFYKLFQDCTNVVNVSKNFLPATTLSDSCYYRMFDGCTNLTTAPELPATTLASNCYYSMFQSCKSLTTAPELPATTLASQCYNGMFTLCTSLVNAPELPATTLASYCYSSMFYGCTKLNYIKMLATNISASGCLNVWVYGVTSIGTFVKNPAMTILPTGESGIPSGWTVVNDGEPIVNIDNYLTIEAIEDGLTASLSTNVCEYCVDGDGNWKTLAVGTATESINSGHTLSFRGELTSTYSDGIGTFSISKRCNIKGDCMSMLFGDNAANNYSLSNYYGAFTKLFKDCTNIITCSKTFLKSTTLGYQCYWELFKGCTNLVSIPELPATNLIQGCYYSMFNGCSSLQTVPNNLLSSRNLSNSCYSYMFSNCTSLTTAPELPATTLYSHCYFCMFSRCTNLTTAPELPATRLENYCYGSMFRGCTKLNYIKMLATNISAKDCLSVWVEDVASSGTFVKNKNATWDVTGSNGVPSGWTVQNA